MKIVRRIKGIFGSVVNRRSKHETQKLDAYISVKADFNSHITKMNVMKTLMEYINGSCESAPYLFMDSLYIVNPKYMMSDFNRRKVMDKTGNEEFISSIVNISNRAIARKMNHSGKY